MYLIYGIIIFIIMDLFVLVKCSQALLGFGVVLAAGGIVFLLVFLFIHYLLARHKQKREEGGKDETVCETITLFTINFLLIGFFLTYLGPAVANTSDSDIFNMIEYMAGVGIGCSFFLVVGKCGSDE